MRFVRNTKDLILSAGCGLLFVFVFAGPSLAADRFQTCVKRFWPAAKAKGVSRETFDRAFQGVKHDPEVIESATYQPEYVKPVGEYVDRAVSQKRIEAGKQMLEEQKELLDALEKRYGVDRHILVAIWGVESNYGTQPGDKNVIRSLATLACSGTKAKFARSQLVPALKILQRGDVRLEAMNGSWAGAMGHTQFIPTTYQAYAVDWDGDGKRNIWEDIPDALASTASYLRVSKWRPGQTWGYEVRLSKGLNPKRYGERTYKTLAQWQKLGIVRANGEPYPRPGDKATLFAPEGTKGPAFLVLNNFRSLLRYNVAKSYALAVGHLSDRLRGGGPFIQPWPTDEKRLSLDQRMELQRLLMARGLLTGEIDGIIGPDTLAAVKVYQRQKAMPVDGYPSQTILGMLRKERQAMETRSPPAEQTTGSTPAEQATGTPPAGEATGTSPPADSAL